MSYMTVGVVARVPLGSTQDFVVLGGAQISECTTGGISLGGAAGIAAAPHAASHISGGLDALSVRAFLGFPGGTATYLRADATFVAPPGGSASSAGNAILISGTTTVNTGAATATAVILLTRKTL